MSRWNRRDRRSLKRTDTGNRTLATMPWKIAATFDQVEKILRVVETTGDIDTIKGAPVFQVPSDHDWYELAPSIEGFVRFYETHADISGADMPTAPLRQLANKFKYGVMIFQSDIDLVRESLPLLRAATAKMTVAYADTLIETVREAA